MIYELGIEGYLLACGFSYLYFNSFVHQMFIKYLLYILYSETDNFLNS